MLPFANYNIPSSPPPPPPPSMEKKKKRRVARGGGGKGGGGGGDQLAVVKAAAWAWYQRNEGKPMTEFEVTRARRTPRPSRYKLEATRNFLAENRATRSLGSTPLHATHQVRHNSNLIDAYEMESISKRLDRLSSSLPCSPSNLDRDHDHGYSLKTSVLEGNKNDAKKTSKSKKLKGLLFRHAAICGRGEDVDLRAFRGNRRLGKEAAAVNMNGSKPPLPVGGRR